MDDAAFKSMLDGLESIRSGFDWWLSFWTWWVVIGVACELVFVIWNHLEEKHDWHKARTRGTISFPARPSRLKLLFELLSVALVVIGVVGELRIDAKLGRLETEIQNVNGLRIAALQKEAGDARDSAQAAAIAAGKAQGSADAAGKKAGEVKKTVEAVGKRAEGIDQEIMMAQALLREREIRNPEEVKKAFSAFKGKRIFFRSYVNDGDGYFLCEKLSWIASDAGATIIDQCAQFRVERPDATSVIEVLAPDSDIASALSMTLASSTPYGSGRVILKGDATIIFVGRKLSGWVGETAQTRDAEKRAAAMKNAQRKTAHPVAQ